MVYFCHFLVWNNFELDLLQGNGYFCAFSEYAMGESATGLFSLTAANIDGEIFSYLVQV